MDRSTRDLCVAAASTCTAMGVLAVTLMLAAPSASASTVSDASAYCRSTKGVVETYAFADSGGHVYAKPATMCNYPDQSGTDPYGHALVDLATLYATKPTMAALAYYAKPAWDGKRRTGQPAHDYCLQLGGAPSVHGSWYLDRNAGAMGLCMFEDGSFMEEWTLFYNQGGSPRGIDLGLVLRYPNPY